MWFAEYEKIKMRKNPILASKHQISGRRMPSWFSSSLIEESRGFSQPPLPIEPRSQTEESEIESEYEEIEHHLPNYSNMFSSGEINENNEQSEGMSVCGLCGREPAVVSCEICNSQLFCGSCNEIFHRHPTRHNHTRKVIARIEPIHASLRIPHQLNLEQRTNFCPMGSPVPPPRRNRRGGLRSANSSPQPMRKFSFDPMGSLKRFIGNSRESLRSTERQTSHITHLPPKATKNTTNFPSTSRANSIDSQKNFMSAQNQLENRRKEVSSSIPLTVLEFGNRNMGAPQQKHRLPASRDSGWDDDDDDQFSRKFSQSKERNFSISSSNLNKFPQSNTNNISHFATLQRKKKSPILPPPPVPPRDFSNSSHQNFPPHFQSPIHTSTSVFELNQREQFRPIWAQDSNANKNFNSCNSPTKNPNGSFISEFEKRTLTNRQSQNRQFPISQFENSESNVANFRNFERGASQSRSNSFSNARYEQEQAQNFKAPQPCYNNEQKIKKPPMPLPIDKKSYLEEPEYYSIDDEDDKNAEFELETLTESPNGPWSCEHCTFVNAKSTKVCSVCCKTPIKGYKSLKKQVETKKSEKKQFGRSPEAAVVESRLSFSNKKNNESNKISLSYEKSLKSSMDESDEDESDEKMKNITREKQRYPFRGQHSSEKKEKYKSPPPKSHAISTSTSPPPPSPPPTKKYTETGTGLYSVFEMGSSMKNLSLKRSSIGTSPPPQEISTQTYEEVPITKAKVASTTKLNSETKVIDNYEPPKVEMSEKALRYARRAQQASQLKRSMSTHLPSSGKSEGRHLYRSNSRNSVASDTRSLPISGPPSRDPSPPPSRGGRFYEDFRNLERHGSNFWNSSQGSSQNFPLTPGEYFASMEDIFENRRRKESVRSPEFELSRLLKEASELNYTPEDLQVALKMCGSDRNPIRWLEENWNNMIETVQTLATKFGRERGEELNDVGTISVPEAKEALRKHKGNVWAAATDCVEQRKKKFIELQSRGNFLREDILSALTASQGNLDSAYVELSKAQLKPFLMRIWGPPSGRDNESIPPEIFEKQTPPENIIENNTNKPIKMTVENIIENAESSIGNSNKDNKSIAEVQNVVEEKNVSKVDEFAPEETFYDPEITEANNSPQSPISQKTERSFSLSLSEPDIDSESHVSDFIQNFQIPPPPIITKNIGKEAIINVESNASSKENETTLETLTKTVSVLTEKIGLLLNRQESENSVSKETNVLTKTDDLNDVKTEEKREQEKKNMIEINIDSEKTILESNDKTIDKSPKDDRKLNKNEELVLSASEKNSLREIYKNEFKVLEQIVNFSINDNAPPIEKQIKPLENQNKILHDYSENKRLLLPEKHENLGMKDNLGEIRNEKTFQEENKNENLHFEPISRAQKIYEAIGNFAGSFLKTSSKKISKSEEIINSKKKLETNLSNVKTLKLTPITQNKAMTSKISDDIYETVNVVDGNIKMEQPSTSRDLYSSSNKNSQENLKNSTENLSNKSSSDSLNSQRFEKSVLNEEIYSNSDSEEEDILDNESSSSEGINDEYEDDDMNSFSSKSSDEKISLTELDFETENLVEEANESFTLQNINPNDIAINDDLKITKNSTGEVKVPTDEEIKIGLLEESVAEIVSSLEKSDDSFQSINYKSETSSSNVKKVKSENVNSVGKSRLELSRFESVEKLELAYKLLDMNFSEEDSMTAANECSSLYSAISFLQQDCFLCAGKFSAKDMVSMLRCTHAACRSCTSEYFKLKIRDHSILDATCPFCKEPSNLLDEPDLASDYFSHLEMILKDILDSTYYEMFGRKLRDWTLGKTPNFKWCSKCSSGFITEPMQTHLICPDCNAVTCAICMQPWDRENHSHRDRDRLTTSYCDEEKEKEMSKSITSILNENFIECPRCHLKFTLARGGCMHLTCSQCRFEFCSGCYAPFSMGLRCKEGMAFCAKLGLHAHHPRNCLFYLRDKEMNELKKLLKDSGVILIESSLSTQLTQNKMTCQVSMQKETPDGLLDVICGEPSIKDVFDICQTHYIEYLGLLIWKNNIDPVPILTNDDLETIIKRANKKLPPSSYGTKPEDYRPLLLKVINDEIPMIQQSS